MLLGAETFSQLLRPGQMRIHSSNFILTNIVFGFIVKGIVPKEHEKNSLWIH